MAMIFTQELNAVPGAAFGPDRAFTSWRPDTEQDMGVLTIPEDGQPAVVENHHYAQSDENVVVNGDDAKRECSLKNETVNSESVVYNANVSNDYAPKSWIPLDVSQTSSASPNSITATSIFFETDIDHMLDTSRATRVHDVDTYIKPKPDPYNQIGDSRKELSQGAVTGVSGHRSNHIPAKRWTFEEEVLLIGSIFVVFAEKGSLFPARRKGKKVGVYTKQCESDTFERVNEIFEECKVLTSRQYLDPRAPKALCRHFKQMKERYINQETVDGAQDTGFMPLIEQWMTECGRFMLTDPSTVRFPDHKLKNPWTVEEETILVGAVFERFFSKGSLCTNKRRASDVDCWKDVKRFYDRAWARLELKKPRNRTSMDLGSQYRKLKKRIHRAKADGLKPYIEAYMVLDKGYIPKKGRLGK